MKNLPMKGGIGGVRLVCPPGRGGWATVTANNYSPQQRR
jgi:hypothetical protein